MPQSGSLNNNNIKKLPSTLLTAWRIIPRSPPPPLGCCETTPTGGRCKYYRRHSSRNRLLCWGPPWLPPGRSQLLHRSVPLLSSGTKYLRRSLFANYLASVGIMLGHTSVFSTYMYRNIIRLGGLSGSSTSHTISFVCHMSLPLNPFCGSGMRVVSYTGKWKPNTKVNCLVLWWSSMVLVDTYSGMKIHVPVWRQPSFHPWVTCSQLNPIFVSGKDTQSTAYMLDKVKMVFETATDRLGSRHPDNFSR